MDMIAEIRRRHLVRKESISSIARDLKLSRPTVRKHCRSQCEPLYRRHRQPTPIVTLQEMGSGASNVEAETMGMSCGRLAI